MNTTKQQLIFRSKPVLLSLLLTFHASAWADVAVIVNLSNTADITKDDIRNIFLGKDNNFSDNQKAIPIELAEGEARKAFLKKYLHKSETELQHLWSIKAFTGKGQPPQRFKTPDEIKKQVAQNPSMIGFIDAVDIDSTVKVITPIK